MRRRVVDLPVPDPPEDDATRSAATADICEDLETRLDSGSAFVKELAHCTVQHVSG